MNKPVLEVASIAWYSLDWEKLFLLKVELGIIFFPLVGQWIKTVLVDDGHPLRDSVHI